MRTCSGAEILFSRGRGIRQIDRIPSKTTSTCSGNGIRLAGTHSRSMTAKLRKRGGDVIGPKIGILTSDLFVFGLTVFFVLSPVHPYVRTSTRWRTTAFAVLTKIVPFFSQLTQFLSDFIVSQSRRRSHLPPPFSNSYLPGRVPSGVQV